MKRIISGIDFSPASLTAAEHGIALARQFGAEVLFAHVISPDVDDEEREAAHRELARLTERATIMDVHHSTRIVEGYPDEALAQLANNSDADLVIVGDRGSSGFERFTLGSVAERTTRLIEGDVLVARGGDPWSGYKHILVPTDFSTAADRALTRALALADPTSNIHLFHSWRAPSPILKRSATALAEKADEIGEEATRRAATLLEPYRTSGVDLTFEIRRGPAAQAIREKLDEGIWDLVVMGSHGRRGIRRLLLGSVAEHTVRNAPCSVLIAHAPSE